MIVVADNLRITLPAIGRAVERLDPEPIRQVVSACMDAGAQGIDINCGPLSRSPEQKMTFLVRTVQETVDLPIVLDTANPRAMAAGLAVCSQKAMINGVSLHGADHRRSVQSHHWSTGSRHATTLPGRLSANARRRRYKHDPVKCPGSHHYSGSRVVSTHCRQVGFQLAII